MTEPDFDLEAMKAAGREALRLAATKLPVRTSFIQRRTLAA